MTDLKLPVSPRNGVLLSKRNGAKSRGGDVAIQGDSDASWLPSGFSWSRTNRRCRPSWLFVKSPLCNADLGRSISNPSRSRSSAELCVLSCAFSGVIWTGGSSFGDSGEVRRAVGLSCRWSIDSRWRFGAHVGLSPFFSLSMSSARQEIAASSSILGVDGRVGLSGTGPSQSSVGKLSSERRLKIGGGGSMGEIRAETDRPERRT